MKKPLPLVESTKSFKINIPHDVETKIRHLCSVIHDVEWSGTLFYKVDGTIETDDFEVTCVDICVMDIGSSAYTEFSESADIITYRIDHDLLEEGIYEGLIHSHNNMSTFFSGTDQSTLAEEGNNTNHFVSLIVNNAGQYTARVTRKVTTESKLKTTIKSIESKWYETYGGQKVELSKDKENTEIEEENKTTKVIEWFNLEVNKTDVEDSFRELDERLAELRKKKVKTTWKSPAKTSQKTSTNLSYPSKKDEGYKSLFDSNYGRSYWEDEFWDNYYGTSPYQKKEEKVKEEVPKVIDEIPLCLTESFDEELTESLAIQLLTGSVLVNKSSINPTEWISKMDAIYEQRFGYRKNKEDLAEWIGNIVDFLVFTEDKQLLRRLKVSYGEEFTSSDTSDICALSIINYLNNAKPAECDSEVLEMMLIELERFIPDGVQDYF